MDREDPNETKRNIHHQEHDEKLDKTQLYKSDV